MQPKASLKFSPAGHRYWLDGRPIPGVTTLLGKGLPKPALMYWSAKTVAEYVIANPEAIEQLRLMGDGPAVAALKQIPWQKRDDAAVRGTQVHELAEKVLNSEGVEVPDHLVPYVEGYASWLERFDVTPISSERPVASREHWYAGTPDAFVKFGRGRYAGSVVGLDLKTSNRVYGSTALQIAPYCLAEFMLAEDGTEQPIPTVEATAVAHVTDAGTQCHPLSNTPDDIRAAFRVFLHIAFVGKKQDWIDGLLGEPIELEEEALNV